MSFPIVDQHGKMQMGGMKYLFVKNYAANTSWMIMRQFQTITLFAISQPNIYVRNGCEAMKISPK